MTLTYHSSNHKVHILNVDTNKDKDISYKKFNG